MTIIQFPDNANADMEGVDRQTVLTLPVAPRAFSRIRFDSTDSPARAVPPAGALNWLEENLRQGAKIEAIDIEGPGDPLCETNSTEETLLLIRQQYPDIPLSVTTLGLHADQHAESLAEKGVTKVTLLVDAVRQEVAAKLYAWIRPDKKTIPLSEATAMLIDEQARAVKIFKRAGCTVTVRTTVYQGYNDDHIDEIARVMAASGVQAMTLVPSKAAAKVDEQLLVPPNQETMQQLRETASKHLQTFLAAEKENRLGIDCSSPLGACKSIATLQPKPTAQRPNVAVASSTGMDVDLHLGQAYQVLIYGPREDGLTCLLGTRSVPEPGGGRSRWEELAASLSDCFAVLAASAGESPRRILAEHDITVLITDSEIEGTVDFLYGGGKKGKKANT